MPEGPFHSSNTRVLLAGKHCKPERQALRERVVAGKSAEILFRQAPLKVFVSASE